MRRTRFQILSLPTIELSATTKCKHFLRKHKSLNSNQVNVDISLNDLLLIFLFNSFQIFEKVHTSIEITLGS
jgi:hypothetical protein